MEDKPKRSIPPSVFARINSEAIRQANELNVDEPKMVDPNDNKFPDVTTPRISASSGEIPPAAAAPTSRSENSCVMLDGDRSPYLVLVHPRNTE